MDALAPSASPLLWGLLLGVRHAADADHLATMASMVAERSSTSQALKSALCWGLGHSLTFLAVGLSIVVFGLELPSSLDVVVDVLIASTLLGLGFGQLLRFRRERPARFHGGRPLALGSIHGLAGSAAIALVALSTIHSSWSALLYLALFATGTVLGMLCVTLLLAQTFRLSASLRALHRVLVLMSGLVSAALGVSLLAEILS